MFSKFLILFSLLLTVPATGGASTYYDERPHISEVPVGTETGWNSLADYQSDLNQFFYGSASVAAMILEMYPDYEYFFLARDAEIAHDTFYLLAPKAVRPRIHLVNVSTDLSMDPLMIPYLKKNGFDPAKKNLVVDTGFVGSVIDAIREDGNSASTIGLLLETHRPNIHPEATVFDGNVSWFEKLPHYTNKSKVYESKGDKVRAVVNVSCDDKVALEIMRQNVAFARESQVRERFELEGRVWRKIYKLASSGRPAELKVFVTLLEMAGMDDKVFPRISQSLRNILKVHPLFPEYVAKTVKADDSLIKNNIQYTSGLIKKIVDGNAKLIELIKNQDAQKKIKAQVGICVPAVL